jgi:hypothetical protein
MFIIHLSTHWGAQRAEIIPIEPEVASTTVGSAMTKLLTPFYTIRHYEKNFLCIFIIHRIRD